MELVGTDVHSAEDGTFHVVLCVAVHTEHATDALAAVTDIVAAALEEAR